MPGTGAHTIVPAAAAALAEPSEPKWLDRQCSCEVIWIMTLQYMTSYTGLRQRFLTFYCSSHAFGFQTRIKKIWIFSWPEGHTCPTYKESFQVRWDNSIPLFLNAAIYLEVSLFRRTSQNAFSRETAVYKWYCYPSALEKTLCKWDIYVPLVTKGLK